MGSVLFLTLRRMRLPIILLIGVYSIGILGLVLIPGVDAEGRPWRMSFFHAFYFLTFTASTIGFGEIPLPFSDTQRLWVSAVIYMAVIGWAYMIATILALVQDRGFRHAVTTQRFASDVRRLPESFYVVCGYGETGSILCGALDRMGLRFVVLDIDSTRVDEVDLQGYAHDAPALAADCKVVSNLAMAGITHPACRGVIAITSDDEANLAAAIAARLLNPSIPVVCRAMTREIAQNMASFGTDHVINPFQRFGEQLWLALHAPAVYRLISRLTGLPGTTLTFDTAPPRGRWIVCGYGRFGREIIGCFDREGLEATIIDPAPQAGDGRQVIVGYGTEAESLRAAGTTQAAGIIAGTDNDVNNLSIGVTARELNPNIFVVLRQNLEGNRRLFDAFKADITMVSAEIVAYQCLSIIATPVLARFLGMAGTQPEAWAEALVAELEALVGPVVADTWGVTINAAAAPALHHALMFEKEEMRLKVLLRDPAARERPLACLPLLLVRGDEETVLPDAETALAPGDRVLFAGSEAARRLQRLTLRNPNVRAYVQLGVDRPAGWLWKRLARESVKA